jgi:hypothetical protein
MFATAAVGLLGQIIGIFGEKGKAKQEALATFSANMQRSLVDEFLIVYWFLPSFLDWFGYGQPLASQIAMIDADGFLFEAQITISASVFGLGKLVGRKGKK